MLRTISGSRGAHPRALDKDMISQQTYAILTSEARIPVAIPVVVETYRDEEAEALDRKLREAANRLEVGRETRVSARRARRCRPLKPQTPKLQSFLRGGSRRLCRLG